MWFVKSSTDKEGALAPSFVATYSKEFILQSLLTIIFGKCRMYTYSALAEDD